MIFIVPWMTNPPKGKISKLRKCLGKIFRKTETSDYSAEEPLVDIHQNSKKLMPLMETRVEPKDRLADLEAEFVSMTYGKA